VKKAVLGEGGVIEGAKPGSVLVDMSSIAPLASLEVAAELAKKGIEMLDAPVSGGEPKAIDGTLAIMVGGKEAVFEKVKDVLLKMGASAVLCGDIGAGNVTKLANQIIVALNIAAMSEAFVLATKPGFRIELHIKDLQNALDTAHETGTPILLTSQVMEIMQALKVDGKQSDDHGGIIQFYEKLAGVKVRKGGAK
jgi:2-hydroxy-3-oxopropionate reductase